MKKEIQIISATQKSDYTKTMLFPSIVKLGNDVGFSFKTENIEALSKIYNREIYDNIYNKNKILVFVHDDVIIEDLFFKDKLNDALDNFDIVGVAGIKPPINIKSPALWHLMGDRSQYTGSVVHFEKNDNNIRRFTTSFGIMPERAVLLDGVFLAINTAKVIEKQLKFDENNPAKFHFYDLNFSLDANNKHLKLGTYPIWITHQSHGLTNISNDWKNGETYFINKYTKGS